MKKHVRSLSLILAINVLFVPSHATAHVTVSPQQVEAGISHNFQLNVPNEKDSAVTEVRLQMPAEVAAVTPNVKVGWQIEVLKADGKVTEIRWYGGEIPEGLRDEFTFRAQAPAEPVNLIWKAHQTYANDEVSAWDKPPDEVSGFSENKISGPYSETAVVGEIISDEQASIESGSLYLLAGTALLLSLIALLKKH